MAQVSYNKFLIYLFTYSIIFIIVLFFLSSYFLQSKSVERDIKKDSDFVSELVFQNLYNIMKMGGDKELIETTIKKIEKDIPNIRVDLKKNDNDKLFDINSSRIIQNKSVIEVYTPILYQQECSKCHPNSQVNEVAGMIFMEYPIFDIKISLKEIFTIISIIFILIVLAFFVIWFHFLKKYLIKPINSLVEQISKYRTHKDLEKDIVIDTKIAEIKLLEKAFNIKNKVLFHSYNKLKDSSYIDNLTKIYNRKKFSDYSTSIFYKAQRYGYKFSFVLIDLDKFKLINDNYGHDIGDKVLVFFTQLITKSIRKTDYLFRMGGDEFYLILNNTSFEGASQIVEEFQKLLIQHKFVDKDTEITINASFGIAQYNLDGSSVNELIKVADFRMYENKNNK